MKGKILGVLLPVVAMSMTSCGQVRKYADHLDDYVVAMKYRTGFNILQLTDIHWNNNTSAQESKQYLDKVFAEVSAHAGQIDLVELTGDQFMLANAFHVDSFLQYFEAKAEQYGFKYATIWGNHDHHGIYNPNWLSERFAKAKHSIHIDPEDDLYGRSNFVINLTEDGTKATATKWQIANLDSGASFSETAVSPFRDYDYIRKDQTDWWLKEHALAGESVPAIAYYHIPQDENLKAWDDRANHKNKFFKLEGFADNGNEKYASNFLDEASQHNLKGAFMGHAHNVDWTVEYMGAVLGLGVKTGPELYYAHVDPASTDPLVVEGYASTPEMAGIKFDLIGASLVSLKDDGTFDLEHLYLNERVNGDFIKWVQW